MVTQTEKQPQKMFMVWLESWESKKVVTLQCVQAISGARIGRYEDIGVIPKPVLGVQGSLFIGNDNYSLILSIKAIAG